MYQESISIPSLVESNIQYIDKQQFDIWYHTTKLYIECIHQLYNINCFPIYMELSQGIAKYDLKLIETKLNESGYQISLTSRSIINKRGFSFDIFGLEIDSRKSKL